MKTIAITIDHETLSRVDRASGKSRSRFIREALQEYLARRERQLGDQREAQIIRSNRRLLARQARALVRTQAKP